jgi:ATP-binding cassette, subfamily B, bacterial
LLLLAGWRVADGNLSLGTALALAALAGAVLVPATSLLSNVARVRRAAAHLERLNDLLDIEPEALQQGGSRPPLANAPIELRGVTFSYEASPMPALSDITLVIPGGGKTVIVGPTGSGKSTLVKVLLGLYMPQRGRIRFGGIDMEDCDLAWLRKQIGVVLQEPHLFDGTIAENIGAFDSHATRARIEAAAMVAEIHDEIVAMPLGYATRVDEGGRGISGGQRQRLALARALVSQPSVLILDEAMSHVDPATEATIASRLGELAVTRVIIAHRPSVAADADAVVVLVDGRLADQGDPRVVGTRNGFYRDFSTAGGPASQGSARYR